MPTKERLGHAREQAGLGGFEIGGTGTHRIVRMLDAPLEQMRAREQLTEPHYQTLARLRWHWFLGYQAGTLRALDLDRISQRSGQMETGSEQEIWHRERADKAFAVLQALEREVTAKVVIAEYSLNVVGAWVGYSSPYHGRQAVLDCLRMAAGKIMSAWLTMDRT
jgi:hypothetical protein